MKSTSTLLASSPSRWRQVCCANNVAVVVILALMAVFHEIAHQDRLLLNLYYLSVAGCAYVLLKRGAVAQFAFMLSMGAATTLGQVYLQVEPGATNPFIAVVINAVSLCVILLLSWLLAVSSAQILLVRGAQQARTRIEKQTMTTHAAALAATSSEIRTPISAILSLTEALRDGVVEPLQEGQREFVNDIDRCGKRLLGIVNDILDYARTESRQIKLVTENVALHGLIEQVVSIAGKTCSDKPNLKITTRLDPDAREVVADPLRLKQVLLNLLSNAVKYSPDHTVVTVQLWAEGKDVAISVRDAGCGIAPEQLEGLFSPYQRVAHGRKGFAAGLGLAITHGLVEMHGGRISVESVPGSGSLFTVRLPQKGKAQRPSEKPSPHRRSRARTHRRVANFNH